MLGLKSLKNYQFQQPDTLPELKTKTAKLGAINIQKEKPERTRDGVYADTDLASRRMYCTTVAIHRFHSTLRRDSKTAFGDSKAVGAFSV